MYTSDVFKRVLTYFCFVFLFFEKYKKVFSSEKGHPCDEEDLKEETRHDCGLLQVCPSVFLRRRREKKMLHESGTCKYRGTGCTGGRGKRSGPLVRRLLCSVAEQHRIGQHYDQAEQGQHVDGHLAADRTPVAVLHGRRMFTCGHTKSYYYGYGCHCGYIIRAGAGFTLRSVKLGPSVANFVRNGKEII